MDIIEILNNNAFQGRNGFTPRYVVCHGTAGGTSAQAIAQYFKGTEGTNNPVSAHYVIGVDGTIVRCNSEDDGSYANGVVTAGHDPWWSDSGNPNPNDITVSIEHCKPDNANATPLTPAQQASSFWLIKDICQRNNIPMRAADASGGVTGHYSIDPVNRARCPGAYDFNALWQYLANGGNTMDSVLNHGWTDDGHTLYAPDKKFSVVLGFRDYVLNPANNWNPDDIPLEAEHSSNPVEMSNTSLGTGTSQLFRMSRLGYAQGKIYKTWIGQELAWYQKQLAILQSQITTLQKLPSVTNLLQINTLASQVVKLSAVQ
jgi:Negative regulator of beta-lactamase expression